MEASLPSNECPSSEWDFLQTWYSLWQNSIPNGIRNGSAKFSGWGLPPDAVQMTGKSSSRQYKTGQFTFGFANGSSSFETTAQVSTTQQAVVADALTNVGTIWTSAIDSGSTRTHHGASFHDQQKVTHAIGDGYYQPYGLVSCVRDTIQEPDDQRVVAFPINPGFDTGLQPEPAISSITNASVAGLPAVEAPSIKRAQLLELPGSESDNRVKWVQ